MTESGISKKDIFTYCGTYADFHKDLENEDTSVIPSWMIKLFQSGVFSLNVSTGYNFYNIVLDIDKMTDQKINIINFTDHYVFSQEDYFIRLSDDRYIIVDCVNLVMMKTLLPSEVYRQFVTTLFGEIDINLTVRCDYCHHLSVKKNTYTTCDGHSYTEYLCLYCGKLNTHIDK
jgi:DNA-directed RNA polymerase subunit RPC12/RpoP